MVLETLANGILALVDWGIIIIVVMFLWECYKFITGGSESGKEAAGKAWKSAKAWMSGTNARAKRVTKKEMNEYIIEENQEKNLDEVRNLAREVVADLELFEKSKDPSKAPAVVKKSDKLGSKIKSTRKYFSKLNRRTTRAQTGITRLLNYMKERGLKDIQLVEKVKVFENNILKLHQQTAEEVGKVEAFYAEIMNSQDMKMLKGSVPTHNYSQLIQEFKKLDAALEDAYKRQAGAKKEMVALISLTRNLM